MNVSLFGEKFVRDCGILQLMDDLGNAMAGGQEMIMLGGGNPSRIPQVEACLRERMTTGMADGDAFERLVGNYAPPAGDRAFPAALADLPRAERGWPPDENNTAPNNRNPTAVFYPFQLFPGRVRDRLHNKNLTPPTTRNTR